MPSFRPLIVGIVALLCASCASTDRVAEKDLHSLRPPVTNENFYFVMTDRFANGDTANDSGGLGADPMVSGFDPTRSGYYQGGDLKGLTQRIEYIQNLGITSIWLTPIFKNKAVQGTGRSAFSGSHGYWITDFTQVDPHLGTNDDLRALVDAAHARGMKVYLDIVTNHTADVIGYGMRNQRPYISKADKPYKDADGNVFDDHDYAGKDTFPKLDAQVSFPYPPVVEASERDVKVPAWLNDVTLYHNRGNTTFVGENSIYGDFSGLDDLFTEHPRVVEGMIEIYQTWIKETRVDGFRIDTMRHVNDEFWQTFGPRVLKFARQNGKNEFFMFGEVFDTSRSITSHFTTTDSMQSVLDFPFQSAAREFASKSEPTDKLAKLFTADDWYTDADSNVYQMPTFLGNHDMNRIGGFILKDNPKADDAELLARDRLAHELMFLSRGNPVVYYGDEQGFAGTESRQTMFASRVPDYLNQKLIGTNATLATDNFEPSHKLYEAIRALAKLTRDHPTLRNGAQQHRAAGKTAGVYAFSRIDRTQQREYVVALNNSKQPRTVSVPTFMQTGRFTRLYGDGPKRLTTNDNRRLTLTVPALAAVVYQADAPMEPSAGAPAITLNPLALARDADNRMHVSADLSGDSFYEVTFQAKVKGGDWKSIGTDDNAPYQVFHDVGAVKPETEIEYRAIVLDNAGHTAISPTQKVKRNAPAKVSSVLRTITIRATVPDGTGKVYLPGNLPELGPWDPAKYAMEGTGRERTAVLRVPDGTDMEFKFTQGSWENEALDAAGAPMENQTHRVTSDKELTFDLTAFKK